jgi:hypothetical protein
VPDGMLGTCHEISDRVHVPSNGIAESLDRTAARSNDHYL